MSGRLNSVRTRRGSGGCARRRGASSLARAGGLALFAFVAVVGSALCASTALALEPISVTIEVKIPIGVDDVASTLRRRAETQALEQAVLRVAGRYVSPARLELEADAIRAALAPRAAAFVLTYRLNGQPARQPSELDPLVDDYVVSITVTVNAEQLRQVLQELGLAAGVGQRPSLALDCRFTADSALVDPFALVPLRQLLSTRLAAAGFPIVEPALYAGAQVAPATVDALAREAGADLGISVAVRLRELPVGPSDGGPSGGGRSGGARGSIVEVRVRSVRAADGNEVATLTAEAPGYGLDARDSLVRALEVLEPQLADGLVTRLDQSLAALDAAAKDVRLRLVEVRRLAEVEAVQQTLLRVLGAKKVRIAWLSPGAAELVVDAPLPPTALRDRLIGAAYPGFALSPVALAPGRIELRVAEPLPPEPALPTGDVDAPPGRPAAAPSGPGMAPAGTFPRR